MQYVTGIESLNRRNKDIKESVIHTLIEIKFDHANNNGHIYNILTAKIIKYKICIHLFHPNKNYNIDITPCTLY